MGKKSVSSEAQERQDEYEDLSFILFELGHAEHYLRECDENETEADKIILLLLISSDTGICFENSCFNCS